MSGGLKISANIKSANNIKVTNNTNSDKNHPKIMVMIPTYNEKENIVHLMQSINALNVPNLHILVVDDNSPDGTWKLVKEYSKTHPHTHLLHRTKDKGRGLAGIAGFKFALSEGADIIVEMDADFSHHPKYIPKLLETIKTCDVVLGSRFVKGGKDLDRGFVRQTITYLARNLIRIILGISVYDCTSGFRCFRRKVIESIGLDDFISKGPEIVQEVLYNSYFKGFKIKEVPIVFMDRRQGESTLGIQAMIDGFIMVWKLRLRNI
ncbi:polyprenol monophosphomannose synthase [Candidatus Woesearchaeota archaeon]|nr:polyprenol monophosphomannose synthase [Candidatus Woesearchaeota archaeon]